jgi:hypothetical protein
MTVEMVWTANGVDSITQLLEPDDFVLQKLATKETVKCFVGLVQEMRPVINTTFLNN